MSVDKGGTMKRFIIFAFAMSFILYVSNVASYAQGKGGGHGPEISGSHGPDAIHGKDADHGKSADHEKTATNKDSNKTGTWEDRIEQNDKLKAKLITLLGSPDLKTAADGFKNEGQFIAALHVSKNLNISFDQLKAKMLGTAATSTTAAVAPESLGKAIHDLKPTLPETDVKKEADKAADQAKEDEKTEKTVKTTSK
jgi:hypothetical protein